MIATARFDFAIYIFESHKFTTVYARCHLTQVRMEREMLDFLLLQIILIVRFQRWTMDTPTVIIVTTSGKFGNLVGKIGGWSGAILQLLISASFYPAIQLEQLQINRIFSWRRINFLCWFLFNSFLKLTNFHLFLSCKLDRKLTWDSDDEEDDPDIRFI
jgi:hypothetical protein